MGGGAHGRRRPYQRCCMRGAALCASCCAFSRPPERHARRRRAGTGLRRPPLTWQASEDVVVWVRGDARGDGEVGEARRGRERKGEVQTTLVQAVVLVQVRRTHALVSATGEKAAAEAVTRAPSRRTVGTRRRWRRGG
jgi:hypothetical protein